MGEPRLKVALVALNAVGYQSLALGYLQAYALAQPRLDGAVGFQVLDLDVSVDAWWVAYRVLGLEPDLVGLSVTCWNARAIYDACRIIAAARPDIRIVLGGPEVGPIAEEVLAAQPAVHAVVRGEGEATFAELLDTYVRGRRPWMVAGVTARNGEEIVSAPDRPLIEDLDEIPSPYLSGAMQPRDGAAYLETYRGCPHRCAYCYEGKGQTRIRTFSRERMAADIEAVASSPGVHTFTFIDPVFNLTPERLRWLSDALAPWAERGKRLHTVEVDIERVDDEAAALLARAGVRTVETGPQSVGDEALAACERSFDAERFAAGVAALKGVGIAVECDLIVGLPGDDAYDFIAGLRFVEGLDPGILQTSTLHVLPGTKLWQQAEAMGLAFDREPPHEIVQTAGIGFADLRRCEVLSLALQTAYRARLG
jgi:anaerobic magnesium-protoporphyrin IX monomethyl ester cyclase